MPTPIIKHTIVALWLTLVALTPIRAQETPKEEVLQLETFRVTAYTGKIPIIDGFTGDRYEGTNEVVTKFATSFNKLLLGYHNKLLSDEIKHLQFRVKFAREFEQELGRLTSSFGLESFTLDQSSWLSRERSIVTRLSQKPFFKIKTLVVWDLDQLNKTAPSKPANKYARDIRFNAETGKWERRITAQWAVFFRNPSKPDSVSQTEKMQGLNLDTLKGFHYIEKGLPSDVPPDAFQEVSLTYPIFYSDSQTKAPELQYLQEAFIANLYYIYDPFSWVARRDVRFRGGFIKEALEHIQVHRIYVNDRDWFDQVFARFLSDVITIKLQGAEEIYSLHMLSKRLAESPRRLGTGLDLLNWNKGEDREAVDQPEAEVRITPTSTAGFRYVMIDAYQRFGEPFVEKIRSRLLAQKEAHQSINGRAMLTQLIEELSGLPYDDFAKRAKSEQEARLAEFKPNRPKSKQAAAAPSRAPMTVAESP